MISDYNKKEITKVFAKYGLDKAKAEKYIDNQESKNWKTDKGDSVKNKIAWATRYAQAVKEREKSEVPTVKPTAEATQEIVSHFDEFLAACNELEMDKETAQKVAYTMEAVNWYDRYGRQIVNASAYAKALSMK